MAIAESFLDGCPDPKKLLEILGNVKVSEFALVCLTFDVHISIEAMY
jgi:hypothetical protein